MATYELTARQYKDLRNALPPTAEMIRGGGLTRKGTLEKSADGTFLAFLEVESKGVEITSVKIQTDNKEVTQILHRWGISSMREERTVYNLKPDKYDELRKILPEYELPDQDDYSKLTKLFTRGGYVTLHIEEFSGKFLGATIDTADQMMKKTLQNMIKMEELRGVAEPGVEISIPLAKLVPEEREKEKVLR